MTDIERRKADHVQICLTQDVASQVSSGFERYRFAHNALPEIDFSTISGATNFFGKSLRWPFLVSSMTGGTSGVAAINERLAALAQAHGWALGLGSIRAAVEQESRVSSFQVRHLAPDVPLVANLGAVQLNYGFGVLECQRALEITGADALVLHLNSLQEVMQTGGNTDFSGLLVKIESLCKALAVPVGVKEVGWGIDGKTASRLFDAGVQFVDVAGAGGTSWTQVERFRQGDEVLAQAAAAFVDWGTPTADCIVSVRRERPREVVIASGGMASGLDAAKAVALGANLVGFGRSLLSAAVTSIESLDTLFARLELEFRIAMFGIGAGDMEELRATDRLREVP
ncbi:MAG: type 2 isopentenyl-diphosphate Delta-isomerase [Firmicutes bacterium]|nr:type 2 isopentenyl-diphosphate Delta-isomerase [Bacillota bacterium]